MRGRAVVVSVALVAPALLVAGGVREARSGEHPLLPADRWPAAADAAEGESAAQIGRRMAEPQKIDLRINIRPSLPTALIEADLTFRVLESTDSILWFLRPDMNLDAVEDADGLPLTYRRRRTAVRVSAPSLDEGAVITWTFRYRARFNQSLEEGGQLLLTRPWYPHMRVTPDPAEFQRYVPMPMSMTATLPQPWVLVSSGTNRVEDAGDRNRTYTWSDSIPNTEIPLVIGRFAEEDKLDRVGVVRGFFDPQRRSLLDPYVEYMRDAATFFSERIGPISRRSWNLVAVDLPENISGLTVPGVTFLDSGYVDVNAAFPYRVLAHEIAHLWWNHYIEIPRARDAWLREGLPTYSSLLFLENTYGNQMMRLELDRSRRVALSVESDEPLDLGFEMATPEAVYAFNYHKAAVVLHMLREVMGLDGVSRLWRRLHELGTDVTTDVFIEQAELEYGDDLSWFFDAWLRSGDVPSFAIRYEVRTSSERASRYELHGTIEQTGAAVRMPVILRIPLEAAPPLERTVWIEPGVTEFSVVLPSPPTDLQFDPRGDLLYREVSIERIAPAAR